MHRSCTQRYRNQEKASFAFNFNRQFTEEKMMRVFFISDQDEATLHGIIYSIVALERSLSIEYDGETI